MNIYGGIQSSKDNKNEHGLKERPYNKGISGRKTFVHIWCGVRAMSEVRGFCALMDSVFGEGKGIVLRMRPVGATRIA